MTATVGGSTLYSSSTKLTFNPSTGTVNAVTFNSTSDINKKTNIVRISEPLNIVQGLNGVTFDWKDTGLASAGLIAQEVEQFLPQLVTTEADGHKSLNYSGVIGVLVEAIKAQQEQIDGLLKLLNK
jgi:hypothetical protein